MAPALKHDRGSSNSIDEDDFFGTHPIRGSNDQASSRPSNERNVIRDGNDVILKQFEMKMIKREYSRNQASRDKKKSAAGAMTLEGVDWSGFPGAAHASPRGRETPSTGGERKSSCDRRGKSQHVSTSADVEEIILVSQRQHRHRVDGLGSSSIRVPISQRRLSTGDAPRALSADSALSPGATSPLHRSSRRISKRIVVGSTSDVVTAAISRTASSRSSRRMTTDLGGSLHNAKTSHVEGGSGSGTGTTPRPQRTRRTTSRERVERHRRPQSEKIVGSSRRLQKQNSSGLGGSSTKRTPRTSNRSARSQSPANAGRRKSTSPHASTRGLAAASATTLDTRRKITSQPSRSRRGSSLDTSKGDFMSSGLKKQSSIRW
jgi:hypothetical protein